MKKTTDVYTESPHRKMTEAKEKMELKDKILNAAYGKASVTPGCVEGVAR